jgi:outer membrane protein OmpA-like peptidoglycan-associated protein
MRILVPGIVVFAIWCYASTYWYVCKIKYLCDDPVPPSGTMVQTAPAPPAETPATSDTQEAEVKISEVDTSTVIHFAYNSTTPETDATLHTYLQDFAERNKGKSIQLIGHTDTSGTAEYNYQLGLERAEAVKNMLVSKGFDAAAITLASKGENDPLAAPSVADQESDRRVEIIIQ